MVRQTDTEGECPEGHLKPLVDYYRSLEPGQFWNDEAFKSNSALSFFLHSEQSTFWMRLVQLLGEGRENEALELIKANPFTNHSWNIDLELAVKRILHYRQTGEFAFPQLTSGSENKHALFNDLDNLCKTNSSESLNDDLRALLRSDEAFAAAFAAAGWSEAALHLHALDVIPDSFPGWVAYSIAQAWQNRGDLIETLAFISKQSPTPPLKLLEGEVLIASGNPDAAIDTLIGYAEHDSVIGYRASWLLSMIYLERNDFEHAKKMVEQNQKLQKSILGNEMLARIALKEGNEEEAHKIYIMLENQSSEAMSFLARRAYANQNFKRARELTEKLLKRHPANMTLRQNLKLIIEQQEAHEN